MAKFKAALLGNLLLISLMWPVSSGSPGQEAAQQPRLQYEVTVALKLVQVYVTDKNGKPVRDLRKEDFIVKDDGKPVAITEFETHDLLASPPGDYMLCFYAVDSATGSLANTHIPLTIRR